jgi:hypothetical protein
MFIRAIINGVFLSCIMTILLIAQSVTSYNVYFQFVNSGGVKKYIDYDVTPYTGQIDNVLTATLSYNSSEFWC